MRQTFDQRYYDRFYRNPRTRASSKQADERRGRFIAGYLKHLELPVTRIVDVGCGLGRTLAELQRAYPRARCVGVEFSAYLCEQYGWQQGSAVDFRARSPFDVVICNDVVGYLDDKAADKALKNLAELCRGALFFGVLTTEDWHEVADQERTDPQQHLRPARWYRQRLKREFLPVGGGVYLKYPVSVPVWALDAL